MSESGANGDRALELRQIVAGYGETQVLHGIDLYLRQGEVVSLLGRNGAGKSTTLKVIMGLLRNRQGSIRINGQEAIGLSSRSTARLGVSYCPENRGIFSSLTVHENLLLPPILKSGGLTVDELYAMFPNLWARRDSGGTKLSGGEQQMLALARILRTGAKVLLLDEPTEGLAPIIIKQIENTIIKLKELGFTILLVEQNVGFAHALADRNYIVETGSIVDEVPAADFERRLPSIQSYLGL